MRIVHIGPASDAIVGYQFGGAIQRRMLEVAAAQVRAGHEAVIISRGEENRRDAVNGVELRFIRCVTRNPLRHIELQIRARADLAKDSRRPDLLHFHSQPEGARIFRGAAARTALSFDYFRFRGGHRLPLGPLYRRWLLEFDALLPCSEFCRDEASVHWNVPPSRMKVLYNGVNTDQFFPDPDRGARHRTALGITNPVILYVGRVCEQKGTPLLLRAYSLLRAKGIAAQLVIAGPVEWFGTSRQTPWPDRIAAVGGVYLGAVKESDLSAVYNMARVFVMPTIADEMFCMAAVEAQACGIPVVASDHGGLRETVPESAGVRFPVGDAEALAGALEEAVRGGGRWDERTRGALVNAERFAWPRIQADLSAMVG